MRMASIDEQELRDINLRIPAAEDSGDRAFFESLLGAGFGFRRPSGEILDREGFLGIIGKGKRECHPHSIRIFPIGSHRALVTCVLRSRAKDGDEWKAFDNARLFAKDAQGKWKLVGWANEPL
jgi:hypothetical protein